MPFQPHIADVLWGAIVTASLSQEWSSPPYQAGDGRVIHDLIKQVERSYSVTKEERRRKQSVDFQAVKNQVLTRNEIEPGERRDFISKVISLYLSWMYHDTPEHRARIHQIIRSLPPAPHSVFLGKEK